ncbi:hypothetical protein DSLASN_42140 [Desulfoluna limicola]|uniref:Peptidase C14 caspase domain-containing protein n=1 Tax=Desulfoluna limicola TaxID=2810562 RepID=A0ABM7PM32_9BACT|nr:caspase family protein [Desulfoluna limicola]BCS98582.1 hypothetical protein DSLASN_42140 [Desulfoluna limicola]
MKRVLSVLTVILLFTSCAQKHFTFEYEGEPFVAPGASVASGCSVGILPEGAGHPGFRLVTSKKVLELVAKTRVQAKGVTNWEIHGYEPDVMLILGGTLSTVAGVVVTPALWVKRLFVGWGDPDSEDEVRQRLYDRHLRSWLFMGYVWAPVDYDVLARRQEIYETGNTLELPSPDGAEVMALDDQRRRVELLSYGDGLHRPVLTDALLESRALHVTAYCDGDSSSSSIDLLPWYRQKYGLSLEEAEAFNALEPGRRPYLLKFSPDLRSAFLALDEAGWKAFAARVPLEAVGDRGLVEAALGTGVDTDEKAVFSFEDDLPALLNASRRTSPDIETWLFAMGIEDYDQTSPITYSRRSAELFTQVAMKRLGVPAENVFLLTDDGETEIQGLKGRVFPATAASIKDQLRFLMRDVAEGDRIYVYYSGHGLPSLMDGGHSYLLARDQAPDFIHTAPHFRVDTFYQTLAKSRADEIVVFMDSCFTGVADGVSVFGNGRAATRLVPKTPTFDEDRMAVITAGTERQFSNAYPEKGHRLFSYFLMKELMKDHETLESLYDSLFKQTRRVSRSRGGTQVQEPTIRGNVQMKLPRL